MNCVYRIIFLYDVTKARRPKRFEMSASVVVRIHHTLLFRYYLVPLFLPF